mgnify:CR=1 FL=1
MELEEIIKNCNCICLYLDGEKTYFEKNSPAYNDIMNAWEDMTNNAIQMPAFGVSINAMTVENMRKGLWFEMLFNSKQQDEGMPFVRLLVNVVNDFSGFNIIRYLPEEGYQGRCFYFQLMGCDMSEFAKALNKAIK